MKIKRIKNSQKIFQNYVKDFNTESNLSIIVDITVAKSESIDQLKYIKKGESPNQLKLAEKVNNLLKTNVEIYTTSCMLKECELFGHILEKTFDYMQTFKVLKCNHEYDLDNGAVKCAERYLKIWAGVTKLDNIKKQDRCHHGQLRYWSLATTDQSLIEIAQGIPGVPVFYYSHSCITILPYGQASIDFLDQREKDRLNQIKEVSNRILGDENAGEELQKKKRKKKNPNPLSVKKSQKTKKPAEIRPKRTDWRLKTMRVSDSVKIALNTLQKEKGLPPLEKFPKRIRVWGY